VLGDRAQDERRRLLVEAVLLGERVHELREDLVRDDGLGQLVVVVGEAAERERGRLLDTGDVVQKERAQQLHHARILQGLDVLRAGGELGDRLHEVDARLLVVLEDLEHRAHDWASECDSRAASDGNGQTICATRRTRRRRAPRSCRRRRATRRAPTAVVVRSL
jgi:hypothetical protein